MPRYHFPTPCLAAILLIATVLYGCSAPVPETKATSVATPVEKTPVAPTKDGPFSLTQEFGPTYAPGSENTATFTMDYHGSDPVTALAIQIDLPLGWAFGAIQEGPKPAINPEPGTTDQVTLVWITAPEFPATVRYTLRIPDWAEGTYALKGMAIYRTLGGELRSPESVVEGKKADE